MKTHHRKFRPPFCPNPHCRHHRAPSGRFWVHAGVFHRKARPHVIRRFRCKTCRRWFSTQTFDTTYWLKRPELQRAIWLRSVECVAHRQAARGLGVVHSTVQHQVERLGRHALLFQASRQPAELPAEALVLDGFRTFEHSQYWPHDVNILVGHRSHYLHGFTDAELRRSGRMTPAQKAKRERLEARFGRPDPKATERAVETLLRDALQRLPEGRPQTLWSDRHGAYPLALRRVGRSEVTHRRESSRARRTPGNPLFAVNVADQLARHSTASHKRETVAFAKRRQATAERFAIFQVWRNFMKPASERRPKGPTPAMRAGVLSRPVHLEELLYRRLFPTRQPLPEWQQEYYWRRVPTRAIPNGRSHRLRYAA